MQTFEMHSYINIGMYFVLLYCDNKKKKDGSLSTL